MQPSMTVDAAFDLFTRPRRHQRTEVEAALLAQADRSFVAYKAGKLALWSWGVGPVVLLVHGWEGCGSQFAPFIPSLRARGFRVVSADCPAHGDSTGAASSVPDFAEAVLEIGHAIGKIAAIIGHSAGAAASIYAFTRGLAVSSSVHLASPSSFERGVDRFGALVGLSGHDQAEFRRRVESFVGLPLDETDLPKLRLPGHPALLLHDPDDKEVLFVESEFLLAAWPSATLERIPGVGHRRILQDERVVDSAVRFVSAHLN